MAATVTPQKEKQQAVCLGGCTLFAVWLIICVGGFSLCILFGVEAMEAEKTRNARATRGSCKLIDYEMVACSAPCRHNEGTTQCKAWTYEYVASDESRCGSELLHGTDENCEGSGGSTSPRTEIGHVYGPPEVKDLLEEYTCYFQTCDDEFTFVHDGDEPFAGIFRILLGSVGILFCPALCCFLRYWQHKDKEAAGYQLTETAVHV